MFTDVGKTCPLFKLCDSGSYIDSLNCAFLQQTYLCMHPSCVTLTPSERRIWSGGGGLLWRMGHDPQHGTLWLKWIIKADAGILELHQTNPMKLNGNNRLRLSTISRDSVHWKTVRNCFVLPQHGSLFCLPALQTGDYSNSKTRIGKVIHFTLLFMEVLIQEQHSLETKWCHYWIQIICYCGEYVRGASFFWPLISWGGEG